METIKHSMELIGFDEAVETALPERLDEAYRFFSDWNIDTHCGKECQRLLDLASPLLEAADPAARPDIWRGIVSAMAIICVG